MSYRNWLKLALLFYCVMIWMVMGALLCRVLFYYPENHWSLDIRWLYGVCVIGYIVSLVSVGWLRGSKAAFLLIVTCGVLSVQVCLLDQLNLLVEYDLWVNRGMPGPF